MTQPLTYPVQRASGVVQPDRLWVTAPGYTKNECGVFARLAARRAKAIAPKISGQSARSIRPFWGDGYFGVRWESNYLWHLEAGTKPHTMRNLAGKLIPMWVPDPLGREAQANPKAKTRITEDGRRQVLIFRKVAKIGARKNNITRDSQGRLQIRDVPASFPGAAGRINLRQWPDFPNPMNGRIMSTVERPHVGVRWRHPGIVAKHFMAHAITTVCVEAGLGRRRINATYKKR